MCTVIIITIIRCCDISEYRRHAGQDIQSETTRTSYELSLKEFIDFENVDFLLAASKSIGNQRQVNVGDVVSTLWHRSFVRQSKRFTFEMWAETFLLLRLSSLLLVTILLPV